MLWYLLGSLLVTILGAFLFLKPDLWWKLTERWKSYRADEPSDFYILSTRIGGAAVAVIGIVLVVLSLTVL